VCSSDLEQILEEAEADPEVAKSAPYTTLFRSRRRTISSTRTRSVDGARPHSDAVASSEASSTKRHRSSTERWPSLDGAERPFESRTIFIDSVLQQSVDRQCVRDEAVAIPKRNRRPQSNVMSRVVMKEPTRLRLDSRQLEFGRGLKCHTSILISSSVRSSKARAA